MDGQFSWLPAPEHLLRPSHCPGSWGYKMEHKSVSWLRSSPFSIPQWQFLHGYHIIQMFSHSFNKHGRGPPMCPTRENKEKQRPGLLMRSLKFSIICGLFLSLASPCSHVHSVNVLSVTRGGGEIQILIFPKFTSLGGLGSIMIFKASMHSFISLFINMLSPE